MMDEVEAVARALADCRLWPGAWGQANDVEREAWLFEARAAIAALDECRRWKPDTTHMMWEKIGRAAGREAGLREAAAVADAYEPRCDTCPGGVVHAILALIDAGPQPTPPRQAADLAP